MKVFLIFSLLIFLFILSLRPFSFLNFNSISEVSFENRTAIDQVLPEEIEKENSVIDSTLLPIASESLAEQNVDMGFNATGWGEGGFANSGITSAISGQASKSVIGATAIKKIEPIYPEEAKSRGITGYVSFKIGVNSAGDIVDTIIVASEPAGVFDRSAMEAIRKWRYQPAVSEGKPISSFVIQKITFRTE